MREKEKYLHIENQLFASVSLLRKAIGATCIVFNPDDVYPKMGNRNRFRILGANGPITLSVPLKGGRNKRLPAGAVEIDYTQPWQRTHWRTLVSAYARAPFFEHYGPALEKMYSQQPHRLWDFNLMAWQLLRQWLGADWQFLEKPTLQVNEAGRDEPLSISNASVQAYMQVFGQQFTPHLSILDAVLNLGPDTRSYLLAQHTNTN